MSDKIKNIGLCEIRLPPEPSKHQLYAAYKEARAERDSLREINAELVEALEEFVGDYEYQLEVNVGPFVADEDIIGRMKAALAKARGNDAD